ncbi:DNA-processing protein DprA, partial [Candidatus Parcubacteria bacterium]|nr:DNA-processing protein DprA [Candidatus Parcubacteria bacterium]
MPHTFSTLWPDDFPSRLREIPQTPKKLYIEGTVPNWEHKFLCVVGARAYTPYGKSVTEKIVGGLRGYPIIIVSGLALGIDAVAHKAALDSGLTTVAVPGSGLSPQVLYPSSNRELAKKIVSSGGALVSEFEHEFRATSWAFPQRNRIMAGLSHAVLVIEAEAKSGTLITSRLATDYNRDVLTVPGSILSKNSEGPHLLIKLGATPITSADDVLAALGFEKTAQVNSRDKYKDCGVDEL